MKTLRAIIIDAKNRTVYEKQIEKKLEKFQEIVEGYIEIAHEFENDDALFVNEEGLLMFNYFFDINVHQPFAGNGLILGSNFKTGESIDCKSDVEEIRNIVKFKTRFDLLIE